MQFGLVKRYGIGLDVVALRVAAEVSWRTVEISEAVEISINPLQTPDGLPTAKRLVVRHGSSRSSSTWATAAIGGSDSRGTDRHP
ncbi:hypothetical protein ACFWOB_32110 [Streptomyces sp. NPDC058420]|uniref:hypothetical protein n=1 Tax=Streptomyces sp. NPDC058420 TaxID=3346489 RepID=UPI003660229C